ncbi:MAG: dipeptidase [Treponema sp.]|nr:dipeptidase [Treponema sp.]
MAHRVIDLHCDTVHHLMAKKDLGLSCKEAHVDLPRLKAGNVALQVFAAYVPPRTAQPFAYALERLDAIAAFAASHEDLSMVQGAGEVREALGGNKTAIMLSVENGLAIEEDLEKLTELRRRGVRILTLVHSEHLNWVASATDSRPFNPDSQGKGLSPWGRDLIAAMEALGMIPDLSHASEAAFWEVLECAALPPIASHSCAYQLCGAQRNLKDDQIKALAKAGGIVGLNFFSAFLSEEYEADFEKHPSQKSKTPIPVPFSLLCDHAEHIISVGGEDILALGADFDGISALPEGIGGCDVYPLLEEEFRARGYSEERIVKIFSGNFLRVLDAWEGIHPKSS